MTAAENVHISKRYALATATLGAIRRADRDASWIASAYVRAASMATSKTDSELPYRMMRAALRVKNCAESRVISLEHVPSRQPGKPGRFRGLVSRDRCDARGCPSCESRKRRLLIAKHLSRAEKAAEKRRLSFFTVTQQAREGESYENARNRLANAWQKFSRTPAFRNSIAGGIVCEDRTWSTLESRRRKRQKDGRPEVESKIIPGEWWHVHFHGLAEGWAGLLALKPDDSPDVKRWFALHDCLGDDRPRSFAYACAKWIREVESAEIPDGLPSTPAALISAPEQEVATWPRHFRKARRYAAPRYLQSAARALGLFFWVEPVHVRARKTGRGVAGACREAIGYSAARGSIENPERMAECLLANVGAQLVRSFGWWRGAEDPTKDDIKSVKDADPEHTDDALESALEDRAVPRILGQWSVYPSGLRGPDEIMPEGLQSALVLVAYRAQESRAAWVKKMRKRRPGLPSILKTGAEVFRTLGGSAESQSVFAPFSPLGIPIPTLPESLRPFLGPS